MAVKRKASPPPPQVNSSDEYSSSDEEEEVAPVVSSQPKPPQRTAPQRAEVDDDESETDSGSDSDPDPPAKNPTIVRHKPLESEESSDEEDDEEEKPLPPPKKAQSEPEKKKAKISEPDQSTSTKPKLSASAAARIWSQEDEIALLRALSAYHAKNGKLPPSKDYGSFLSTISGSIGFPVTEKQLVNKVRMMRTNYCQKKKKGTGVKISKPHDKAVFDMSAKLFDDSSKGSKKRVKLESNSDTDTENGGVAGVGVANGRVANGGVAHSSAANGDALAKSNIYLRSFIEEMSREQQLPSWITVENVIAQIGEPRVQKMNAKIRVLRIDSMKLRAREENMKAELFATLGVGEVMP